MIIELYGLSGSGKTTFAKKMAQESGFQIIKIRTRLELLYLNALFLVMHPWRLVSGFLYLTKNSPNGRLFYYKLMNTFLHVQAKYAKAWLWRGRNKGLILDQGYVQNVISLFETEKSQDQIEKYMSIWIRPDILVAFDSSKEVREERLRGRGDRSRQSFGERYLRNWEEVAEKNAGAFTEILKDLEVYTMVMSTDADLQKTETSLKKIITQPRLFYITNARIPSDKAHAFQIAKMCETYARLGYSVELWLPYRKNPIQGNTFSYFSLEPNFIIKKLGSVDLLQYTVYIGRIAFWLQSAWFLLNVALRSVPSKLIYTRSPEVAWLMNLRGKRVVYEAHNWPNHGTAFLSFLLRSCRLIVANSSGTAEEFRKRGFENVLVAPNGVDLEDFKDINIATVRQELDLPPAKKLVMYVGHFYDWKGADMAVETWKKSFAGREAVVLVLVGGHERDISRLKGKIGGDCSNILLLGHKPKKLIPKYLMAADILILPNQPVSAESEKYTSPIKMFEYMASGRPIVASDLPSIREILGDETALFFEPTSGAALVKSIEILLADQGKAKALAEAARHQAESYTWKGRAERISAIFRLFL